MVRFTWSIAVLSTIGCSDYGISDQGELADVAPVMRLSPAQLDFGEAGLGEGSTQSFTISNAGNAALHVSSIEIEGSSAFELVDEALPLTVPVGESVDLWVDWTPVDADDVAQLTVSGDDPATPRASIELQGTGLFPILTFEPSPLDFGAVLASCSTVETLSVVNTGHADLEVDSLINQGPEFEFLSLPELPLVLAPGEQVDFDVLFTAPSIDVFDGSLWATSNDPAGDRMGAMTGEGVAPELVEERFVQGDGPWEALDLVFYVDQSCSMTDNKRKLREQAGTFMEELGDLAVDWQVATITRHTGCINGSIIDGDTENPVADFQESISGPFGSNTEAGLTIALEGLRQTGRGECNEGLLRDGARTAIVLVSDEPEQSDRNWDDVLLDILGQAPSAMISSIVGDMPHGCETAEAGNGYFEATLATHGLFLSICQDEWTDYLDTIASVAVADLTDTFTVEGNPDPDTIEVLVGGVASGDWTWDEATGSVVFDYGHWPTPYTEILVSYSEPVVCD